MTEKDFKSLIDRILNEKISILHSRIDTTVNNIITQFEQVKDLDEITKYDIPEDFQETSAPDGVSEEKIINTIHESIKKISTSANQLNLINNYLEGINQFCSRAALFLVRDDKLVGWKGSGFLEEDGGIDNRDLKRIFFSLSASTVFKVVLEKGAPYSGEPSSQPDDHLIYSRFGGKAPKKVFVLPFFVKGKPQAITYTDSMEGQPIGEKEIEIITSFGEMSLDLLPLRQKILSKVKTQEFVEEEERRQVKSEKVDEETMQEAGTPTLKAKDPERLARVIINDIILYNEKVVEEGLLNHTLYSILEDTIEQSKELYLAKYDDISAFEKQLVETLAKGDKEALKGYNFETL